MICNVRNIITHVNALWPGSCHDDSIFKGSSIYNYLKDFHQRVFLISDKGYLSMPFLLTPFKIPQTGGHSLALKEVITMVYCDNLLSTIFFPS